MSYYRAIFSPDSKTIAGYRKEKENGIWVYSIALLNAETGRLVQKIMWPGGGLMSFSPDGKNLCAGGSGGTAMIWDLSQIPKRTLD